MSICGINIEFDNIVYTKEAFGGIEWKNYRARINQIGITLFVEFQLTEKEKLELYNALVDNLNKYEINYGSIPSVHHPHWQAIPASMQKKL